MDTAASGERERSAGNSRSDFRPEAWSQPLRRLAGQSGSHKVEPLANGHLYGGTRHSWIEEFRSQEEHWSESDGQIDTGERHIAGWSEGNSARHGVEVNAP